MSSASVFVAALTSALVLLPASAASTPDLPAAIADLDRSTLDLRISPIDTRVAPVDTRITELKVQAQDSLITLNSDILFGFDKDTLSAPATTAVGDIAEDLPQSASVTITGYTDDVGEDDYNLELSERRATAVEQALTKARPDLDTTAEGRGSADPVEPNSTGGEDNPEGRAKNRRVEITVD